MHCRLLASASFWSGCRSKEERVFRIGIIAAGAAAVIGLSAPAALASTPVTAGVSQPASQSRTIEAGPRYAWVVFGGCYYWVDPVTGIWSGPYACVA